MKMIIQDFLQKYDLRIKYGDKWLSWNKYDKKWVVYQKKFYSKKVVVLICTDDEEEACKILIEQL